MSEMIERAKHAAWGELARQSAQNHDYCDLDAGRFDGEIDMAAVVRTVIEAIRKPTEAMVDAARECADWGPSGYDDHPNGAANPEKVWEAMIDQALLGTEG